MKKLIITTSLFLFLNGCSLIYSYDDHLPQRINQWIAEGQYKKALNTISHIDSSHKDYKKIQKQKKKIIKYLARYENTAILKSTQLSKQGNWVAALQKLDTAAKKLPDEKKITRHKEKLLKQRKKIIQQLETKLLNQRAINLSKKMSLYDKIKKTVTADEENKLDINEFDQRRDETSKRLTFQSEQQYKQGKINKAEASANLALKLKPEKQIALRLKRIKKKIKKETDIKKSAYLKKAEILLSKLSQGYSHAILQQTKKTIKKLKRNKENSNSYKRVLTKLEWHFKKGIEQYFKAARKLYSKEKTQEALSIWLDLEKLKPNYPKLQSHIKRAKKVLSKLKALSNKTVGD